MTYVDPSASPEDVLAFIKEHDVRTIDLQFTDVAGLVKTVTIDAQQFAPAMENGVWFDGSAVEGVARVAEADMYLKPDPSTFALLPWESHTADIGQTARVFCDVHTPNGQPFAGDPRGALRRAMELARSQGMDYVVAPELEFYLFKNSPAASAFDADDDASYFDASVGVSRVIRKRVSDALRSMGFVVESSHHEVGSGQHELDLAPMNGLRMADALITARQAVRIIAAQEGRFATFMPKPITDAPGNGLHVHQRLYDVDSGANRFANGDDPYGLSDEGKAFLAGQLAHAREICAVLSPLVNSYKRLMSGQEAPIYVTWAQLNRGALLRVPRLADPNSSGTQIEMRCPDPSCNPYLAFALMLHAGLSGIENALELPPAAEEELYEVSNRRRHLTTLPITLHEALDEFEDSDLAREALGLHLFERFLEAKRLEWEDYLLVVTPWELDRYLSLY